MNAINTNSTLIIMFQIKTYHLVKFTFANPVMSKMTKNTHLLWMLEIRRMYEHQHFHKHAKMF